MRRVLSELRDYAVGLTEAVGRGWGRFFFAPADPTPLGLIRLIVGLLLTWNLAVAGFDLHAFLGSTGWADPAVVRSELAGWGWSFWFRVPDGLLVPVWLGCLAVLLAFALGLWSRVTAVLAWVIVVSTARRVPVIVYGFDQVVSTWVLYLAVTGASGQAVSLDRFLSRWRRARAEVSRRRRDGRWVVPSGVPVPTVSANLALRLIQLHLCLIYGMAGLAKLQSVEWWDGSAMAMVWLTPEFRRFNLLWLATNPYAAGLATRAGLFLELSYPALIWVRPLRPLILALVIGLHIGIDLSLGLSEFVVAMLAANLAFVSGSWLRGLVSGRVQPAGRVLYDGACPRCRASMALVAAADPDRVVEPVDLTAVEVATIHPDLTRAACLRSMHLVRSDGRIKVGYDAVMTLARWLPLFGPIGILGSLPGVAWLGRRAYNSLAASRPRDVPCTDEVCGLHASRSRVRDAASVTEPGRSSR